MLYKMRKRATSPAEMKMVHMSIRMPENEAEELRLYAKERDISMSDVMRKAIRKELNKRR